MKYIVDIAAFPSPNLYYNTIHITDNIKTNIRRMLSSFIKDSIDGNFYSRIIIEFDYSTFQYKIIQSELLRCPVENCGDKLETEWSDFSSTKFPHCSIVGSRSAGQIHTRFHYHYESEIDHNSCNERMAFSIYRIINTTYIGYNLRNHERFIEKNRCIIFVNDQIQLDVDYKIPLDALNSEDKIKMFLSFQ